MPELPEVEVVRRGLAAHVLDRPVRAVEVLHPRPVRRHLAGPSDFADRLVGSCFTAARRRGKYLWLPLSGPDGVAAGTRDGTGHETGHWTGHWTGTALLAHLGMSGQMLVQPAGAPDERHLRVRVRFADDGPELRFVDQRMFGGLSLSQGVAENAVPGGGEDLPAEIAHIARDPLDPAFDAVGFTARLRRRTSGVKRLLLDQGLVSGVGNIYADEALWRARLHGERAGDRLRAGDVAAVLAGVRAVMTSALDQGGTSFDALYVNVNGESGYFDRSLEAYGQEGRPCSRCGTAIVRSAFMNRSSYWCPTCQPRPRARRTPR